LCEAGTRVKDERRGIAGRTCKLFASIQNQSSKTNEKKNK